MRFEIFFFFFLLCLVRFLFFLFPPHKNLTFLALTLFLVADFRFLKLVDFAFRPFPYCLSMILMMNFWLLPIGTNFLFYKRGLAHFIVVLSLETLRCTLWLYIHLYRFCTAIDILQTRCQFDWNTYISILNST